MLKNYLKVAIRSLLRHKSYAAVNLAGLTLGIASCLFVLLYVQHETSFDAFHHDADRIYRVNGTSMNPEGDFYRTVLPPPVAPALAAEYPEIEAVIRVARLGRKLLRAGEHTHYEDRFYLADAGFFETFAFEFVRGNLNSVLAKPAAVVITESTAEKYFGRSDVVGEVMNFENRVEFSVTGVIRDVPSNTHFQFDFMGALRTDGVGREGWLEAWDNSATETYVRLRRDSQADALEAKLAGFVDAHMASSLDDDETYRLSLQPLENIHLYPHRAPEEVWSHSNLKYVYAFPALGAFILLIACINYMNMATARAMERAREIGMRKVLGSQRAQLIGQFFGESLGLTMMALTFALIIVEVFLPQFNQLSGKSLTITALTGPAAIVAMLGMAVLVAILSGSYPAFYLSALRPTVMIQGGHEGGAKSRAHFRSGLVLVQFVMAIVLILGSIVVGRQLVFLQQKELGYDKEHMVIVPIREQSVLQNTESLRASLLQLPGVLNASFSSGVPNNVGWHSTARWQGAEPGQKLEINHIMVDYDFIKTYGLELAEGRDFSPALTTDATAAYLLNETAVKAIGWQEPIGKKFTIWNREGLVIGVVKDFHYESLHEPIGPIAFHFGPRRYRAISIKIRPEDIPATLSGIEATILEFAPGRPFEYRFLDASFDRLYRTEERFASVVQLCTLLAVFLACLGLLGLTAFMVEQRAKEISVRKVLGASALSIVVLLGRRFVTLVAVATLVAAPLGYLTAKSWLQDFAFHIDLSIGLLFAAGFAALLVTVLTVGYQSIRAAVANPVEKLRYQ